MKYSLTDKLPDRLPMTPPDDPPEPDLSDALPCPQCGYEPLAQKNSMGEFSLSCDQRHLTGPWCRTLEKAIEHWNTECETMKGENLKAEGVEKVSENNATWSNFVIGVINDYAALNAEFTSEDVRRTCFETGLSDPKSPNAWGAAFSVAAKQGLIVRVGYTKNHLASAHARVVAVWKGKS